MDEEDTEDVIFQDSPLYHHLKDMGYDDFETAQKSETMIEDLNLVDDDTNKNIPFYFKEFLKRIYCSILENIDFMQSDFPGDVCKVISSSHIIQDNDCALLKDLLLESTSYKTQTQVVTHIGVNYFYNTGTVVMATAVISISYIIAFIAYLEASVWNIVLIIFACIYFILVFVLWTFQTVLENKSSKLISQTEELLKSAENLQDFFKKGIRMIQEAELIARGFTLISVQATAQRLEGSVSLPVRAPEKQCPELRESIFLFAKECFITYRDATCQLLHLFPVHKDIDMSSHYLACIKLEDLGPIFTTHIKDDLITLPDFITVSSLKSLVQLMELQQSEFFRRFGLSLVYHPLTKASVIFFDVFQVYSRMEHVLSCVMKPITSAVTGLHKLQLYYKHLGLNKSITRRELHEKSQSDKCLRSFEVAVHSLRLHLQASIIRVQDLEGAIESSIEKNEQLGEEQIQSFLQVLCEVKSELDASSVCLEESISRLPCIEKKEEIIVSDAIPKPLDVSHRILKPPIPLFDLDEPVFEDQVFEAFTSQTDDDIRERDSDFWFSDEKKFNKKSRDSSANLLKELKSVLVDKAVEHQKREERAKAKHSDHETKAKSEELNPNPSTDTLLQSSSSKSEDSAERSTSTLGETSSTIMELKVTPGKSDSDSTGSIEIIHADSPLEEKLMDFFDAEHDSASTESIEACGESPMTEITSEMHSFLDTSRLDFASTIAAQVAQRSLLLGLQQQTFSAEPEETFEDSAEEDDS